MSSDTRSSTQSPKKPATKPPFQVSFPKQQMTGHSDARFSKTDDSAKDRVTAPMEKELKGPRDHYNHPTLSSESYGGWYDQNAKSGDPQAELNKSKDDNGSSEKDVTDSGNYEVKSSISPGKQGPRDNYNHPQLSSESYGNFYDQNADNKESKFQTDSGKTEAYSSASPGKQGPRENYNHPQLSSESYGKFYDQNAGTEETKVQTDSGKTEAYSSASPGKQGPRENYNHPQLSSESYGKFYDQNASLEEPKVQSDGGNEPDSSIGEEQKGPRDNYNHPLLSSESYGKWYDQNAGSK
ncbi:uncharacterized protein LOC130663291 isoform X2 [Microplitis mediator]|uniref:uncharacterized protein LOC130663291 isoform X2 n=1 Tax=Microplitis mediator TaxID=375433 RepID=UPI002557B918|nr:uncharacterized protein LOC130663291 isoform X2 [Microplitis mediator]